MPLASYSEDQRDCLQEICNVAMGQAGDIIARKLGVFVNLSIPLIRIVDAQTLPENLENFDPNSGIHAASQLFANQGENEDKLSGLALVMLSEQSLPELKQLMPADLSEDTVILETCRNMAQTCLDALSSQWQLGFQCQPPDIVGNDSLKAVCESFTTQWQQVLTVEINYHLEGRDFNGDLVLLFPDTAIDAMAKVLDELLA